MKSAETGTTRMGNRELGKALQNRIGGSELTTTVLPRKGAPVVALQLWFSTGTVDERAGEEGLAHFSEHMLFRLQGGERSLHEAIGALGGEIGALTAHDWTQIYLWVPQDRWSQALHALVQVLGWRDPTPEEVESEKRVVLEELSLSHGEPVRQLTHGMLSAIFDGHPYGRTVTGRSKHVEGISSDGLLAFMKRGYGINRASLWVAGDVSAPDVTRALLKCGGQAIRAAETRRPTPHSPCEPGTFQGLNPNLSSPLFMVAYPMSDLGAEGRHALQLGELALGQGAQSVIGQLAGQEDCSLLGGAVSLFQTSSTGVISVLLQFRPGQEETGLNHILGLLESRQPLLSAVDIERCERQMVANENFGSESTPQWLTTRAQAAVEGRELPLAIQGKGLSIGRPRIVNSFLERLFREENRSLGWVSSESFSGVTLGAFERAGEAEEKSTRAAPSSDRMTVHVTSFGAERRVCLLTKELPSKLRVMIEQRPGAKVAGMVTLFPRGIADETGPAMGLSSMLSQGLSQRHASEGLDKERVETLGGALVGFARLDSLGIQGVAHGESIEESLHAFLHASFSDKQWEFSEFERLRNEQVQLLTQGESVGAEEAQTALRSKIYGPLHPYARGGLASREGLEALSPRLLSEARRTILHGDAPVIAIVGPMDVEQVLDAIQTAVGVRQWNGHRSWQLRQPEGNSVLENTYPEGRQAFLAMGARGLHHEASERAALEAYISALCGFRSPLSMKLREELGLVYALRAESTSGGIAGAWCVETATPAEYAQRVHETLCDLLQSSSGELSDSLLSESIRTLSGRYHMIHERALTRALGAARRWHYGHLPLEVTEEAKAYGALEVDSVRDVGQRWVRNAVLSSAVVVV